MPLSVKKVKAPAPSDQHWRAELALRYCVESGKTRLRRDAGFGPLVVQKPFYPEGDACHVYLIHPPGGIVGGDRLLFKQTLEPGAQVVCTMPGATKFYRSAGEVAELDQVFSIASDACLEWLPTETLIFDQARVAIQTHVDLQPGSRFFGWDCLALGRPASRELFASGSVQQTLKLWRVDKAGGYRQPLLTERLAFKAGDPVLHKAWGLDGKTVMATCYATPVTTAQLAELRAQFGASLGLTLIDDLLVARLLDDGVEPIQDLLRALWAAVRPMICSRVACPPRIWNT